MKNLLYYCEVFSLIVGFSAVLCLTIILLVNQGFYVGVKRFIPENNLIIRYVEIVIGVVSLPFILKILKEKTT